jgi:transposase
MRLYPLAPAEPTPTTRAYPSSLTDAEWAVLRPLVRRPATPRGGRPPKHPPRAIVDAIRSLVRTGCAWRLLPRDFPQQTRCLTSHVRVASRPGCPAGPRRSGRRRSV